MWVNTIAGHSSSWLPYSRSMHSNVIRTMLQGQATPDGGFPENLIFGTQEMHQAHHMMMEFLVLGSTFESKFEKKYWFENLKMTIWS